MVRAATATAARGTLTPMPPHGRIGGGSQATVIIEFMRKRTSQQRQREMAARARSRELAARRRRRSGETPQGQWERVRVAGTDEEPMR